MSLGQRIRQLRQTRGLTQSQLGGADLSKSFISLLEKDRTQPSLETIVLLARRLETSVDALLGQNDHLPDMVGEGLLALARDAERSGDHLESARLLD
ncbi:MAG TPA: helix-turn-helix transcriptional regulator, partial [bacterium]